MSRIVSACGALARAASYVLCSLHWRSTPRILSAPVLSSYDAATSSHLERVCSTTLLAAVKLQRPCAPGVSLAEPAASASIPMLDAESSSTVELEARVGIDGVVGTMEHAAEASTSVSQAADELGHTIPAWRKFLDPTFKPEVKRSEKLNQALALLELRSQRRHRDGRIDRAGLSPNQKKELQKAQLLINHHLKAERTGAPRTNSKRSTVVKNLEETAAMRWISILPHKTQVKLKLHFDGKVRLEALSKQERELYDSAYNRAYREDNRTSINRQRKRRRQAAQYAGASWSATPAPVTAAIQRLDLPTMGGALLVPDVSPNAERSTPVTLPSTSWHSEAASTSGAYHDPGSSATRSWIDWPSDPPLALQHSYARAPAYTASSASSMRPQHGVPTPVQPQTAPSSAALPPAESSMASPPQMPILAEDAEVPHSSSPPPYHQPNFDAPIYSPPRYDFW